MPAAPVPQGSIINLEQTRHGVQLSWKAPGAGWARFGVAAFLREWKETGRA